MLNLIDNLRKYSQLYAQKVVHLDLYVSTLYFCYNTTLGVVFMLVNVSCWLTVFLPLVVEGWPEISECGIS